MSDYKTGNSNSAYTHDPNVYRQSCSDCGQRLESSETFGAMAEFIVDHAISPNKS